jgi:hypothetical protein
MSVKLRVILLSKNMDMCARILLILKTGNVQLLLGKLGSRHRFNQGSELVSLHPMRCNYNERCIVYKTEKVEYLDGMEAWVDHLFLRYATHCHAIL